jgi:hypothetical protein
MMIRQHKDEILTDEGNAARTGVVALIPTGSSSLDPGKRPASGRNGRESDGRIGGSTRGDVHRWG